MTGRRGGARGQSIVEFALVLPLVLGVLLFVVQIGLVVRDRILVVNAAREGARTAAVDPDLSAVRRSAIDSGALDPSRLSVNLDRADSTVTVTVSYVSRTEVPIIGALVGDVAATESVTMHLEQP
ncbi:MAG: TadE/TadG family type IV pilus assembly protein [Acidimicrobiales bacterium]